MTQLEQFKLLAECYASDLKRLDFIQEGAWYLSQLGVQDGGEDIDYYQIEDACKKERRDILLKQRDLNSLIVEMEESQKTNHSAASEESSDQPPTSACTTSDT